MSAEYQPSGFFALEGVQINPHKIVIVTDKEYVFEPVLWHREKGCQKFIPFLHPKQSLAEIFDAIKQIPFDQTEAVLVHAGIPGQFLLVTRFLKKDIRPF